MDISPEFLKSTFFSYCPDGPNGLNRRILVPKCGLLTNCILNWGYFHERFKDFNSILEQLTFLNLMIKLKCVIVRFRAWDCLSAFTCLEDWCMGWWKIEMIVHNSDTHILLSWTWPKHERFFKYHYSNWKFTHTKGDTTLLSKNAHWSKQIILIKKIWLFAYLLHFFCQKPDVQTSFLAMNINNLVCSEEKNS